MAEEKRRRSDASSSNDTRGGDRAANMALIIIFEGLGDRAVENADSNLKAPTVLADADALLARVAAAMREADAHLFLVRSEEDRR